MEAETLSEEEARQSMIASGRDYLDTVTILIAESSTRMASEAKMLVTLRECKVTWLERLAAMMGISAARRMEGNDVQLVFADTDGDAVLEEETGEPSVVFDSFDDISRMVVSVPKK